MLISLPTLFIIWNIRDQNATQQIENQRKDINLKEFQKIAEWVSGAHLIEEEITDKLTNTSENILNTQLTEQTIKYTQPNSQQSIPTFSKRDGAVGLQIAAIYNLLPFFQGKHGEDFRKPALNLLTSAWLALQQKEVLKLEQINIFENKREFNNQIKIIRQKAKSPIGIALTEVLLSDGGNNLLKFPGVFPNLNLAGMDFHLPGLDKKVLTLFKKAKNCRSINLIGANLQKANLQGANLQGADLQGAILQGAILQGAILQGAILLGAILRGAILRGAILRGAHLQRAHLQRAHLQEADLQGAILQGAGLQGANLQKAHLQGAHLQGAHLQGAHLQDANLHKTDLQEANLYKTDLQWADLQEVNLYKSDLHEANLQKAHLQGANLQGANLQGANLQGANLQESNLLGVKLSNTMLSAAITFTGSIIDNKTNSTEILDSIKSQGGIILYNSVNKEDKEIRIRVIDKQDNKIKHLYYIDYPLDLEKTREENPAWDIDYN
ncbi:pentapeptide repeat-containing protein [Vespertiliibacter pulmonis]|uniref:pentapeptide repeat-containing protein n=1 Tax=Vespertiliibacter pulmonis TaxID=1443036 RepID=UPI0014735830|nr:pentapeptide repeat-containing protein [Vespertiliibacter pulmonis]